jgi:hypothetical protein
VGAKVVNVGLQSALEELTGTLLAGALVHLYTNNYTPIAASVLGDFTELASSSYTSQEVLSWGTPVLGGDGYYTTTGGAVTFNNTSGSTWTAAYGYFITDETGTVLVSAALFASPIAVVAGGNLPFSPIYALGSEY